jgi:hypothetical protein
MGTHAQVLVRVVEPRRDEAPGGVQCARPPTGSVQNLAVSADGDDPVVADRDGCGPVETQDMAVEDDQAGWRTVVVPRRRLQP